MDNITRETYKVKTPKQIIFGDPLYFEMEQTEIDRLTVNTTPKLWHHARVVLTEELDEDDPELTMRFMEIFIAPEKHLPVYMSGCKYAIQDVKSRQIGVDSAAYILEVDGVGENIHTAADGYWGDHMKYIRNKDCTEILDCEMIRIYMPDNETLDSMRGRLRYMFKDVEQIENIPLENGDDSEDEGAAEQNTPIM